MKLGNLFRSSKMTRILYGSDFHGSEAVYRKFLSASLQYEADILIVGGDVTGKAMIPIVHQGGGRYVGYVFGRREEPSTPDDVEKLKKTISNVGFYPIVIDKDEAQALESDKSLMDKRFEGEMIQRVRDWMELAEQTLLPKKKILYFMPGNDDLDSIDAIIDQYEHIHNPDMRRFVIEETYELYGLSNSNMTPWACARDLEEEDLAKKLEELEKLVVNPDRAIMALHVPPYGSTLDVCPELDENLKIITMGGQVVMKSAGSTAVKAFIDRMQPMLTLHGHIHESPGHTRLGRTLAINAGSEYAEGILKAAIINLEGGKVKGHLLISG